MLPCGCICAVRVPLARVRVQRLLLGLCAVGNCAELEAAKQVQVTEKKRAKAAKNPVKHMDLLEEALDAVARKPSGSAAAASNNKSQKGKNAAGRRVKSRKGRANALLAEVAQFNNVLAHSAFQNDPAGTIHQHIANTLAQHTQHAEQS
eukprot:m.92472 g.92472  ORF g.92472 m.92472 type:complete len:149 (-) comp8651_c0_seq2:3360-3806(-)